MRSTMSPHMHAAPWCPSACSALCFGVRGPRVPWVLALAFMIRMAYIISHCVDGASQSACFECNWLLPPAGYGSGNFAGGIRTIQDGESWSWRQYVQLAWGLGAELVSTMFASSFVLAFPNFYLIGNFESTQEFKIYRFDLYIMCAHSRLSIYVAGARLAGSSFPTYPSL